MKNASVISPGFKTPRTGRGYSKDELAAAKFSIKDARDAGLIVDLRRQTKYPENVASLKENTIFSLTPSLFKSTS